MSAGGDKRALDLRVKRIYAPADDEDGMRILVDRLWPRGVSREEARIDEWLRELAPSDELRKWFRHEKPRFEEFRRRYQAELQARRGRLSELRAMARRGRVTLLYAAKDDERNNAIVLAEVLRRGLPISSRPDGG